jgi:hypothetical protein
MVDAWSELENRMRPVPTALCSFLVMLGLSACDRATDGAAESAVATVPGPIDRGNAAAAAAPDEASMRYRCEGGYVVAITGNIASVTTRDGRTIDLPRVAGRSPPLFAGEALEFAVNGDGAVLGQDEGGPFPCEEAV